MHTPLSAIKAVQYTNFCAIHDIETTDIVLAVNFLFNIYIVVLLYLLFNWGELFITHILSQYHSKLVVEPMTIKSLETWSLLIVQTLHNKVYQL